MSLCSERRALNRQAINLRVYHPKTNVARGPKADSQSARGLIGLLGPVDAIRGLRGSEGQISGKFANRSKDLTSRPIRREFPTFFEKNVFLPKYTFLAILDFP